MFGWTKKMEEKAMRHNHILAASLLGGIMILSAACVKEKSINDQYRPVGSEIRFSAATVYNNGAASRTEYSGYINNSNQYERINWVKEDPISIVYKRGTSTASAGFEVTSSITPDQEKSKAEIAECSDKLYWADGTADHEFFAMYPTKGFKNNETASLSGNHVEGAIPNTQIVTLKSGSLFQPAMEYGYMVAYKKVEASSTATTVELPFCPAMTAFQFRLSTQDDKTLTVSSFEMSSNAKMAGKFAFDITGGNDRGATGGTVTTSNTSNSIKVTFSGTAQIKKNQVLDFTVFALPVDMTQVTIKLNFSDDTSKRLELRKNATEWFEFKACKKYLITNTEVPGTEVWTYYVEDITDISTYGHVATSNLGFTVKSYRKNTSGTTEPVKWKVQYATSKSGPWSDTQPTDWTPSFGAMFSLTKTSGNGSLPSVGEANAANIARDHDTSEKEESGFDSEQAAIAVLQGRGTLPSSGTGYFDLSKHPYYPIDAVDGSEIAQETANCYVITRPGKYKFPLVYGNAIRNGATNSVAYAPQGTTAVNDINYFLRRFVRHDDLPIVDPWLKNNGATPTDAVVVWQDVTNADMQILLDDDISVDADYVYFEIKSENIRPGNIVLAARKNGTIVWSWHLWVTEKDLTPHHIKDKHGLEHDMMKYNLGWTDKVAAHGMHWNDWPFYVRIIQTDASGAILNSTNPQNVDATGAADVFSVTQFGESISVDANVGSNCFYQWGRKDPMLPAASTNSNKRIYSAAYSLEDIVEPPTKVVTFLNNNGTFGQSIKIPYNIFYSRRGDNHLYVGVALNNEGGSIGTAMYGNLWDTGMIAHKEAMDGVAPRPDGSKHNAITVVDRLPVKSVYDPCPPGYVVPYTFAFTGFCTLAWNQNWVQNQYEGRPSSGSTAASDGINFADGLGGTIYIPYAGARAGDGGDYDRALYEVTSTMYYWTAGKCPADGSSFHKSRTFTTLKPNDVRPIWEQYSEGAYAIRPVLQVAYEITY